MDQIIPPSAPQNRPGHPGQPDIPPHVAQFQGTMAALSRSQTHGRGGTFFPVSRMRTVLHSAPGLPFTQLVLVAGVLVPGQVLAGGHSTATVSLPHRCQRAPCYHHRAVPHRTPHRPTHPWVMDQHTHGCVSPHMTVLLCHLSTSHQRRLAWALSPAPIHGCRACEAQQGRGAGSPRSSGSRMDSNVPVVLGGAGGRQGRVGHGFRHQPRPWVRRRAGPEGPGCFVEGGAGSEVIFQGFRAGE